MTATGAGAIETISLGPGVCQLEPVAQDALDLFDLAADDRGVEAVTRNRGILFQDAHGGMARHAMGRETADMMVGACAFEKAPDERGAGVLHTGGNKTRLERLFEVLPIRHSVLAGERVLHIAQDGWMSGGWIRALHAFARFRTVFAQGFEPAPGFFFKIV